MSTSLSSVRSFRHPDSEVSLPAHETANAALSDRALRRRSRRYGSACRILRRRFLATLPEIDRRGLAESRGGILPYAAKVGGATPTEVKESLALAERLADLPEIWRLFELGEVGRQTLRRVPVEFLREAPAAWASHLVRLPRAEVIELVKAERERRARVASAPGGRARRARSVASTSTSRDPGHLPGQVLLPGVIPADVEGAASEVDPPTSSGEVARGSPDRWSGPADERFLEPIEGGPNAPASEPKVFEVKLEFTAEEYARLLVLVEARSKESGRPRSRSSVLKEVVLEGALDARPGGGVEVSPEERTRIRERAVATARVATGKPTPRPVQRDVTLRSGGTCEWATCVRPGEHFHHRIAWRARRDRLPPDLRDLPRHHPDAVVHLCSIHHGLLHEGRIENPSDPPDAWRLAAAGAPDRSGEADRRFQEHRARARGPGEPRLPGERPVVGGEGRIRPGRGSPSRGGGRRSRSSSSG